MQILLMFIYSRKYLHDDVNLSIKFIENSVIYQFGNRFSTLIRDYLFFASRLAINNFHIIMTYGKYSHMFWRIN